jgi:hypothetical protein
MGKQAQEAIGIKEITVLADKGYSHVRILTIDNAYKIRRLFRVDTAANAYGYESP